MKNIKYLFLVLSLIFVFEIVNSNQAKACTVNSGVVAKASGDGTDFIDAVSYTHLTLPTKA